VEIVGGTNAHQGEKKNMTKLFVGNSRIRYIFLHSFAIFLYWALSFTHSLAQTCVEPPQGIIAWWPFDEASGTIANDIIGNNPGAYVGSPVAVLGEVGNARSFNGTNYVGVVDSDLWAFGTANFTIEFWVNFSSQPGGTTGHPADIFIGNDEASGNANKWFFAIGGGNLEFHINSPTLGPQFFPLVPFSPIVNQWYHLAITRSGSTYTIYIDGCCRRFGGKHQCHPECQRASDDWNGRGSRFHDRCPRRNDDLQLGPHAVADIVNCRCRQRRKMQTFSHNDSILISGPIGNVVFPAARG